jgi:hypothetical protein
MLKIDREAAVKHLECLGYKEGDTVFLRAIPGKGYSGNVRKGTGVFPNLPWSILEEFQEEGKGIYFVVNGQGDKDTDVTVGKSLFIEHDDLDKSLQIGLWETLGLPEPSIQVETRKSIHSYWFIGDLPIDDWQVDQSNLLDFSNADKTIKNPSRVMRLAGSWHVKTDEAPVLCNIISSTSRKIDVNSIRNIVGTASSQDNQSKQQQVTNIVMPLEVCLTKADRDLVNNGVSEGGRNAAGAKLARNLLATQQYLQLMGHRYTSDAESLFAQYCNRCNPAIDSKEARQIWASASTKQHSPSLTAEAIEQCISAWHKRNNVEMPTNVGKTTLVDVTTDDDWEVFKTSIAKLVDIADPFEQEFRLKRICTSYKMGLQMAKDMLDGFKGKAIVFDPIDIADFMEEQVENRVWLVGGHLPLGSVVNLCAMGGSGKTALAYELAQCVALGNNWNNFPVTQGRVLIIQSDEPELDSREKMDIQSFYNFPKDLGYITFDWQFTMIDQVEDFIVRKDVKLIVIDSLAGINLGLDRDKSGYADNLRVLRNISNRRNCTFLVLDHTNKAGGNLGTVAVHNAVSEMAYLRHPTEDEKRKHFGEKARGYRILTWEKSRSGLAGVAYGLQQNARDYSNRHLGLLELLENGEPPEQTMASTILKYVMTLRAEDNCTASHCAKDNGISSDDAFLTLETMRRTGMIGSTWIVPDKGAKHGERWRVYHALNGQQTAPVEEDGDITYEYTVTYDSEEGDW